MKFSDVITTGWDFSAAVIDLRCPGVKLAIDLSRMVRPGDSSRKLRAGVSAPAKYSSSPPRT